MKAKILYRQMLEQLQQVYNRNEAAIITDWVMEKLANISKADFIKEPELELANDVESNISHALQELLQHKPVQYVLGEAWFGPLKLLVNEHVLIPRPETEELVHWILNDSIASVENLAILDIGTGSGCLPIYLKKKLSGATVYAIDISEGALNVARQNAAANACDINFIQADFLGENSWGKLPSADVIVSNPPYIPANEREKMDSNVTRYEPHTALFVPDNRPLIFYEKIALFAASHLNTNGKVFAETHEDYAGATAALFEKYFAAVEIRKDLFGKERMICATHYR